MRGLRHRGLGVVIGELDRAALIDAERHGAVEEIAEPLEIPQLDRQRIVGLVAGQLRRPVFAIGVVVIGVLRVDRKAARLHVALGNPVFLQRRQHLLHRRIGGRDGLPRGGCRFLDAEADDGNVGGNLRTAFAGHDDHTLLRPLCRKCGRAAVDASAARGGHRPSGAVRQ